MRHTYGMFGAVSPTTGLPTWGGVPSKPTYGFGSLGAVETIEDMQGLTIPSDHLNTAKIYGGLGGLGRFGADAPAGGTVSQSLGMFALQRLIGAAAGYYIGSKLGPKGSHAGVAGAAATLLAGPLGLAGVAAYYSR